MHQAQLLVFGLEDRLAEVLQELAQARSLWMRPVRHVKTCLHLLRRGGPTILVLRLGANLEKELALLDQVTYLFPRTKTVVVGSSNNPQLAGLAWDLGAAYALFPPQPIESIRDIVMGFLHEPPTTAQVPFAAQKADKR